MSSSGARWPVMQKTPANTPGSTRSLHVKLVRGDPDEWVGRLSRLTAGNVDVAVGGRVDSGTDSGGRAPVNTRILASSP